VADAIKSILNQSFNDFELIIINDGSTDNTLNAISEFNDERIILVNQKNIGLALTLNKAISIAKGDYLARQDADDISLPLRLSKQVSYLDENRDCGLVGTWSFIWQGNTETERGHKHFCNNGQLQVMTLFDTFFVHSSVMIRASTLEHSGIYPVDPQKNPPEDFDLWLRIAKSNKLFNIPEELIIYREIPGSISREKWDLIQERAIKIASENLFSLLKSNFKVVDIRNLVALLRDADSYVVDEIDFDSLKKILDEIRDFLVLRWPADKSDIDITVNDLHKILNEKITKHSTPPQTQ
jgi:glycosyltransferase involved in cell wall biosynthesis